MKNYREWLQQPGLHGEENCQQVEGVELFPLLSPGSGTWALSAKPFGLTGPALVQGHRNDSGIQLVRYWFWIFLTFAVNAISTSKHVRGGLKQRCGCLIHHKSIAATSLQKRSQTISSSMVPLHSLSSLSQLQLNDLLWMQERSPHHLWLPRDILKLFLLVSFFTAQNWGQNTAWIFSPLI